MPGLIDPCHRMHRTCFLIMTIAPQPSTKIEALQRRATEDMFLMQLKPLQKSIKQLSTCHVWPLPRRLGDL